MNSAPTGRLLKCQSFLTLHSCDQKAYSFSNLCTSWKTKSMMDLFASSTLLHIHSVPHIHTWAIYDEFSAVGDGRETHLSVALMEACSEVSKKSNSTSRRKYQTDIIVVVVMIIKYARQKKYARNSMHTFIMVGKK